VKANTLDLTLFQFDFDLSLAMFFMNADKTIYGRYGTRASIENAESHMSVAGLAAALEGAIQLHKRYPENRAFLKEKQAVPIKFKTPNDFPSLKGKFGDELDYGEKVVQSCIHCHQVADAQRFVYRDADQPIPENLLYPYPLPQTIGLEMNVDSRATVKSVSPDSPAEMTGIKPGDRLITLDGQAILSIADIQWALHHAPTSGVLPAMVQRGNKYHDLSLLIGAGWRKKSDISWRVSSWELRRMTTGGIRFMPLTDMERANLGIQKGQLALRVKHLGQYGEHGVAKRAGVDKGDVLVLCDRHSEHWTITELLGYLSTKYKTGDLVEMEFLRGSQRIKARILQQ